VVEIEPLEAGQRKDATAALSYFGNATLVLTDFPGDIRVTVTDPAAEHNPQEAGELAVTAGALTIALDGPSGSRELSVELADGTSEVFAVKDKMPGAVVLEGLPAGTVIHLVEGPEGSALSSAGTARDDIREVQAGVGISAPLRLDSLLPGDHELSLVHPVLGSTTMRFAPLPGETDHRSILWETMSNATQVKAARQDWEQRHAASKQVPKATKLALATAGGTAALAAGTAVVGAMAMGTRSDLKGNDTDYTMALNSDDGEAAWSLYSDQVDLKRSLRTTGPIALGGLGITAAGAGVTVVLFGRGRAERKPVADWDLWSLPSAQVLPELPVPQPADTPADTPVED
jgi:hypothetical protein